LGVLTSGGDASGMNAAIRAVVRAASADGIPCVGIRRGYSGLIAGDTVPLGPRDVDGLLHQGGTHLYTARCKEFMTEEGREKAAKTCERLHLTGVVAIGGDGTFRGLQALSRFGVSTIGIPGTIDNDIACTDYTIGFDTACNTAVEAIDKLRDTMQSHERCSIVEVMGRRAGYLALTVGIASGAIATLIPEVPVDFERDVTEPMRAAKASGRNHHIIIVAEGVGRSAELAEKVRESTGVDTRVTILGHIQRGGSPSARDRLLASEMGAYAVDLFEQGKSNRIVAIQGEVLHDLDIDEALAMKKTVENYSLWTARRVSS